MTYTVGLTGGIGCGKTTAAEWFAALGASVVDTDVIAHRLTETGQPAAAQIDTEFGAAFFDDDGNLDRAKLRDLVFSDSGARARLEAILHPVIRRHAEAEIGASRSPYSLLIIPLLFETRALRELVNRVLVVDCSEAIQIVRAMRRSHLTEAQVRAIMATQLSRAERVLRADDVLDNDGDREATKREVAALHLKYLELTRLRSGGAAAL